MPGIITLNPAILTVDAPDGALVTLFTPSGTNNPTAIVSGGTAVFPDRVGTVVERVLVGDDGEWFDGNSVDQTHGAAWMGAVGSSASQRWPLLARNSVGTDALMARSVISDKIATRAITAAKMDFGVLRTNYVADSSFEELYTFTEWDPFGSGQGEMQEWRRVVSGATPGRGPVRSTTDDRSRTGRRALQLYAAAGEVAAVLSNTMELTPGRTYRLTVNALSLGGQATMIVDAQQATTIDGIAGFDALALTGDSSWGTQPPISGEPYIGDPYETYTWTFTVTAGKPFVALRISNYQPTQNSTLVIDDVSVVETGVGGAMELTASGFRLFDDSGSETAALMTTRPNYFTITNAGQPQVSLDKYGAVVAKSVEVTGRSPLISVVGASLTSNVATITTVRPHGFQQGEAGGDPADTVTIANVGAPFDGTYTVTSVPSLTTFTVGITNANVPFMVPDQENLPSVNKGTGVAVDTVSGGLTIYGREFLDYLDDAPKGLAQWGAQYTGSGNSASTTGIGVFEISLPVYANRMYKICTNAIRVRSTVANDAAELRVHMTSSTPGDPDADPSTPLVASSQQIARSPITTIDNTQGEAMLVNKLWLPGSSGYEDGQFMYNVRLLLAVARVAGTGNVYIDGSTLDPIEFWVEDIGPGKPNGGQPNDGGGGTTARPPQTYVKTWTSTDARSYMGSGSPDGSQGPSDMKQGYSSYDGDSSSMWIFPNTIYSTVGGLSASAITRVRVYLYANHWYYNSGGTARIKRHGFTTLQGSAPSMTTIKDSANWPKPGGRWVDITSSAVKTALVNGTMRGIGVGPAGTTSQLYYGRFNKSGAKIEITYTR